MVLQNSFLQLHPWTFPLLLLSGIGFIDVDCVNADNEQRPIIVIAPQVVVKGSSITLADIARISNGDPQYEQLVVGLKNIKLGNAPPPKAKSTLLGEHILAEIQKSGMSTNSFGYTIPKVVTIERAGREVTNAEVLEEVRSSFTRQNLLDLQVREVSWSGIQTVPVGSSRVVVEPLGKPAAGQLPVRAEVFVDEQPAARFLATALVDDWREVPVVTRTLERGMLIDPADIQVVRLNLLKLPADIVDDLKDAIGKKVKARIPAGGTIRKSSVDIAPLILKGKRIKMIYQSPGLTATAIGEALEDGHKGLLIKVRNESSKRIVDAIVNNRDEVQVGG